jgi:hypothetical protein
VHARGLRSPTIYNAKEKWGYAALGNATRNAAATSIAMIINHALRISVLLQALAPTLGWSQVPSLKIFLAILENVMQVITPILNPNAIQIPIPALGIVILNRVHVITHLSPIAAGTSRQVPTATMAIPVP